MKKLTKSERASFLFSFGQFYANLGGTFGTYRTAGEAWEQAKNFKPYSQLQIGTVKDQMNFETGFNTFQNLRIAMQLEAARVVVHNCLKIHSVIRVFLYRKTVVQEQQRVT